MGLDDARAAVAATPCILEGLVDFEREISVITARGQDGAKASYVPVENRHRDQILVQTIAPARIAADLADQAQALAERIAAALDLVGLLAVEMFVTRDRRLLVNELAPRPHNSGHWTIDACAVSQFEQLVRAVCGLPLGEPGRFADAVMDNLLGTEVERWPAILAEPGARLHLYGKGAIRPGRKLGHVTRVSQMVDLVR
jgi:5-(carboxyamino)imidazole ribonucleotide synthase